MGLSIARANVKLFDIRHGHEQSSRDRHRWRKVLLDVTHYLLEFTYIMLLANIASVMANVCFCATVQLATDDAVCQNSSVLKRSAQYEPVHSNCARYWSCFGSRPMLGDCRRRLS
jgi:hypothetical protein